MGVRDEGKKRLKGKHRPPFFFYTPALVPGCQAATMLSWPFFGSIGTSVGLSQGDRRGRSWEGGGWGEEGRSKASLINTDTQAEC